MQNVYYFKNKLLIRTENVFDSALGYSLRVTFVKITEKQHLAAENPLFQENIALIFGENIKIKFSQNSLLLGDFSALSGNSCKNTYASYDNFDNHINSAKIVVLNNQENVDNLTDMILGELSDFISTQMNNIELARDEGVFFADLVLEEFRVDQLPHEHVEGKTFASTMSEKKSTKNLFSEDVLERINSSFVRSQGQIQWQDSSGNLHTLPIT